MTVYQSGVALAALAAGDAGGGSGGSGGSASSVEVEHMLARAIMPESYGALGNDPARDDSEGIQLAINAALAQGRGVVSLRPDRTYFCGTKLAFDPSRVLLDGNGARLDFRRKTFADPAAAPELVGNFSFEAGGSGWQVTGNANRQPVYADGEMRFEAPADTYSFLEMGRQITAKAGSKLRVVLEIGQITTVQHGANTYRSLTVGFRHQNLATGGVSGKAKVISNQDGNYKPGAFIQWDVPILTDNPFLRIQTNANITIRSISVKALPDNTCILIQTPEVGGLLRGHNERAIQNLKVAGRSDQSSFVDLFEFETQTPGLSSRTNFYNVDGSEGVGRALLFGNRAYLMNFHSCRFTAANACVETLENPDDAGENISFFGGNLGAGACGIRNRGMGIRMFGTSIDFSRQFYVGSGNFEAHGGWFETYQHEDADVARANFAETQYRFDVHAGNVKLFGGYIQMHTGEGRAEAIFRVARNATIDLVETDLYNLRTTSGAMCVGEGRISMRCRGGINKETEAVLSRTPINNRLLGDLDNAAVIVNAWLTSTTRQKQPDRRTIQWLTNKAFTGTLTRGSVQINTGDNTGLAIGMFVEGDGVIPGTSITAVNGSASITLSNPVGGNGVKSLVAYGAAPFGTAAMTADEAVFRTGGRSLKVQKTGIGATSLVAYVAVPVERGRACGGEAFLKVPGGLSGTQTLFFDTYFAALAQGDSSDAPILSATRQGITNQNIVVDLAAGLDWTRLAWRSTRVDASSAHDGYAPEWATHIVLAFNMASMPNGFTMHLDDIVASTL